MRLRCIKMLVKSTTGYAADAQILAADAFSVKIMTEHVFPC